MQEEKQNKQIRFAIDELQHIPGGFEFDSQRVWSGLEQQLPGKKKKRMSWYYAAAVVLLITSAVYFSFMAKNTRQILYTSTAHLSVSPGKKSIAPVIHQEKNQSTQVTRVSVQSIKKKTNRQINLAPVVLKESNSTEAKESLRIIVPVEQTAVIIPPINDIKKEEPKKLPVTVLSKAAPKRYKVIHINELNPVASVPDLQNNMSRYEFKKTIQYNEEKETLLPADNTTKQILFFKLKPSTTTTTTIVEN